MKRRVNQNPPRLMRAYVLKQHALETLDRIHHRFAAGAHARFNPSIELFIHDEPQFYGKRAEDVRESLDSQDYTDDFVVVEDDYDLTEAVWYVGSFTQDDEDHGPTVGGRVLWKMRTVVDDVPMRWVNYDIGNMDLAADIDIWPYDANAIQQVQCLGFDYEGGDEVPAVYLTAEINEYEEGPGSKSGLKRLGAQESIGLSYRLKEHVAKEHGLLAHWTVAWDGDDWGGGPGSKSFAQKYDPKSSIWKYTPLQH